MIKRICLACIFTLLIIPFSFSNSWEELITLEFGGEENQIGAEALYDPGLAWTLKSFNVDDNGNIYLIDNINFRIIKYDSNGKFEKILLNKTGIVYSTRRSRICYPYLYLISDQEGILKFNLDKEKIVWIKEKKEVPDLQRVWENIQIYNDKIIYYKDSKAFQVIDENGEVLNKEQQKKVLDEVNKLKESVKNSKR